jgi:hypothetical protein
VPDLALAEPEPVIVTRWRCPFCRQSRSSRPAARRHIARCWHNPASRSCKTCAHYEYEPDGEYCVGTPCDCNQGYEQCGKGVSFEAGLKAGCPLWALKEAG